MKSDILINCESYLFTVNEAARLLRMSREKFIVLVEKHQIPFQLDNDRKMFAHRDIKAFQIANEKVIKKNNKIYGMAL